MVLGVVREWWSTTTSVHRGRSSTQHGNAVVWKLLFGVLSKRLRTMQIHGSSDQNYHLVKCSSYNL